MLKLTKEQEKINALEAERLGEDPKEIIKREGSCLKAKIHRWKRAPFSAFENKPD